MAAPMQGYTEAVWRNAHAEVYGCGEYVEYFSPFMRVEKGDARMRDMRDALSPLNSNHKLTPQIIFRDAEEFRLLLNAATEAGHMAVDLNLGCPFPPQCKRGRGAAMVANCKVMEEAAEIINTTSGIQFSVKMRPGLASPDEWRTTMPIINGMRLSHLTIHPRTARQQYGGEVLMDIFTDMLEASCHPVVFNGDISSPADIARLLSAYPTLRGVMAGRGLLGRPSLFAEWHEGGQWTDSEKLDAVMKMHRLIFGHYCETLCGDTQILSKIKPFWEYLEPTIGRKRWKAIHKATGLQSYSKAISDIS